MQKGFFGSLFDISFSSLVTTKVIKVLYVISLIVIGLFTLGFIISAFASSAAFGVITLVILGPLFALLYTVWARVVLEFIIVVFRIAEYNGELVALQREQMGLPPRASTPPLAAEPVAGSAVATPPPTTNPPGWRGDVPPPPPTESTPPPPEAPTEDEPNS